MEENLKQILEDKNEGKGIIVDVREPEEVAYESIDGAFNLPLSSLEQGDLKGLKLDKPVFLICQSGSRSKRAFKILQDRGFHNLTCIEGGLSSYKKSGGKTVVSKGMFPLMRQVQITAGSLVFTGFLLSQLVHPWFIYLCAFVGLGLTFSGLSGLCPMARVLEKMPWNRMKNKSYCEKNQTDIEKT